MHRLKLAAEPVNLAITHTLNPFNRGNLADHLGRAQKCPLSRVDALIPGIHMDICK